MFKKKSSIVEKNIDNYKYNRLDKQAASTPNIYHHCRFTSIKTLHINILQER